MSASAITYTPKSVLDIAGLDRLKAAAASDPSGNLQQVADDFSSLFIDQMLQSMQNAGFQSALVNSRGTRLYRSLLDQQIAQNAAGHGMGLASMLVTALRSRESALATPSAGPSGAPGAPATQALTAALSAGASEQALDAAAGAASGGHMGLASLLAPEDAAAMVPTAQGASPSGATPLGTISAFVQRFGREAESVARKIGVSAKLVLAQAALETGWGAHPSGGAGGAGHNLFGIKAGANWGGPSATETTTEDVGGDAVATTAAFRSYASDAQSFDDYAHLIGTDPRYAAVRSAATPEQAAWALQYAGYATDPAYASKLIDIMHEIGALVALPTQPRPVTLADVSVAASSGSA
ncbi:MAG TPA: flagellar assembly peptidoglycan hydrolase FlgJ [Nevskiaceae bacterium]|nr:flagellar assembly peptidoglycan hydrolase FlgJ [Nevskiaceae bacterium]